MRKFISFSY